MIHDLGIALLAFLAFHMIAVPVLVIACLNQIKVEKKERGEC
jgi:hypothetical protein